MLQVRLLGQFDIVADGKRMVIPARAGQSLFAYIVLHTDSAHRREKLAGLIWPDTSDELARRNLRQQLWLIRKALAASQSGTADYLQADEISIGFNPESAFWLDVAQLERPIASDDELNDLINKLALYRGELLPGFYDDWVMLERQRVQSVFEARMQILLERLVAAERWAAVLEWGEKWLSFGDTPEPAFRALMLAYAARGDMAKVTAIYQRGVNALRDELGVEPSVETRALYDGLVKGAQMPTRVTSVQLSGTVTFLFTDIEGSTRLLDRLGDAYATVLGEHHELLRAAVRKWNGSEVGTHGDAFFVTFARALDAVQCAADAQRALAGHAWLQNATVRVRMGLHTGEPLIAPTGYVGMDVHRAARIGDAGHGGQVLLSQTTRELVLHDLPPGVTIRELGEHRLKDMKYPTPIYQLVIDGLPADFPPLNTKFTGTEAPTPGEPPFKGLQYFEEQDSDLFFGREFLTAKLVNRLHDTQILSVIIGASGSGKSSLVRAGLIPALKRGAVLIDGTQPPIGSAEWRVHVLTPTAHPLQALAMELTRDNESVTAMATLMDDLTEDPRSLALFLARQDSQQHTLLLVDQFEELFTLCHDEFERQAFIDNLLYAITPSLHQPITIVLTLRADFYAHLAQYPELRDAVAKQQEYIGPMTTEELRRAIEEPAKHGHWEFEPGLVDLILRDVGDEPGALPLLSHALLETWKRRAGYTMTLKGYAEAGGVRGAIAHTAQSVYENLAPAEQEIARNIFLRLTELGEGTEDTRRRASFDELMSNPDEAQETRAVLNMLANARLVMLGEDTAEVAHEALIREWPTLREWLNQDREGLRLHRNLTEAAQEWELLERDAGALYRGARLAQTIEWSQANPNALNNLERAFLDASVENEKSEEREREAARQRELQAAQKLAAEQEARAAESNRANKRLRQRAYFLASAFVLAIVLAGFALFFGEQSNQNAVAADQNAQAAAHAQATAVANADAAQQAKVDADTQRNAAQKSEANAIAQQRIATARELAASALNQIGVDPERAIWLALHAVKTTYDVDKSFLPEAADALHRAVQGSLVEYKLSGQVPPMNAAALSPDGSRVVIGSANSLAKVYDASTGEEFLTLKGHEPNKKTNTLYGGILDVTFSPDGTRIATAGQDNTARIWDAVTGNPLLVLNGKGNAVLGVAFNADGTRIVTAGGDGTAIVWDAQSGKALQTLQLDDSVVRAVFSPNGKYVATASYDQTVRVWNAASGEQVWQVADFESEGIAFSPDSQWLASGGISTTVKIFDAATGKEARTFSEHAGWITDVEFSPDGKRIASASTDHTVKIWDSHTGQVLQTLAANDAWVTAARFSTDGKRLVTSGLDGTAKLWDVNSGKPLLTFSNPFDPSSRFTYLSIEFNPDGTRVAAKSFQDGADGAVKVWSVAPETQGKLLQTLPGTPPGVRPFRWSADGTRLVTTDPGKNDKTLIRIWDMTSHDPNARVAMSTTLDSKYSGGHTDSFDASLTRVALRQDDDSIKIFDLNTGKLLLSVPGNNNNWYTILSPDGTHLVTPADDAATADVWDLASGQKQFTLTGQGASINLAIYSPDGKRIATGSGDGTVKIWDVATGKELLTILAHDNGVNTAAFSADGTRLATSSSDTSAKVWDVGTGKLLFNLLGHTDPINGISFSTDGSQIATASTDGTIRIWSTTQRNEVGEWAGDLITTNADATRLATLDVVGDCCTIQTWDTAKDSPFAKSSPLSSVTLPIQGDLFESVNFSPDWKYLATGQSDGTVQIWDAASGRQMLTFKAQDGQAYDATFSPDGTRLLTNSDDGTAKVWDIASALKTGTPPTKEMFTLSGHHLQVNIAVYSPDGTRIATGTARDGLIKVWDAAMGKELMPLSGHTSSIFALAFSPDGKRLISGSRDLTAKIWDVETDKELSTLRGHSGTVDGVAFSQDGRLVVTTSKDGTTKVWDSAMGAELITFATPGTQLFGAQVPIAFNLDGTRLYVSEGADGVREYVLPIEDLMALARTRVTRTLTQEECQKYLHMEQCTAP